MKVSPGLIKAKGATSNWRNFTYVHATPFSAFIGKTVSPTWRSAQSTSIESLNISDPRWNEWEMSSQLMTVICLASCSVVNWRLERDLWVVHASATRMQWRKHIPLWHPTKMWLLIEFTGKHCAMKASLALKSGTTKNWWKTVSSIREYTHSYCNIGLLVGPIVLDSELPDWDCKATLCVHRWTAQQQVLFRPKGLLIHSFIHSSAWHGWHNQRTL